MMLSPNKVQLLALKMDLSWSDFFANLNYFHIDLKMGRRQVSNIQAEQQNYMDLHNKNVSFLNYEAPPAGNSTFL